MAKQSGTDLDDVRSGSKERAPQIRDLIDLYEFPKDKWVDVRLLGKTFAYAGYWVQTKKKDGSKGTFFVPCPSYDPVSQQRDSTIFDPWREAEAYLREKNGGKDKDKKKKDGERAIIQFTRHFYINGIIRGLQRKHGKTNASKKEKKTGFKDKDNEDSSTPVRVLRFTPSNAAKLAEFKGLNTVKKKGQTEAYAVTHERYGQDLRIKYSPDKAPSDQYQIIPGERTPLTEEELAYLQYDLSDLQQPNDPADDKQSFARWVEAMGLDIPMDDEDEGKGKKSKKSKKPSKDEDEDEDDEDLDDDSDDEDDDEDDRKSKKSKKGSKDKKKSKKDDDEEDEDDDLDDDDSDEDDDEEDEDDDEDDRKSKSKKSSKKDKKSKKSSKDDDDEDDDLDDEEDEDEDDEDDEDEDDSKSKKSKGKKEKTKSKKSSKDDDDEDDDLDDDEDDDSDEDDDDSDEDEDDEPKKSKSKKSKGKDKKSKSAKSKKSKKSSKDDDDDEEDDDEDDDLDDDDD